MGLSFREVVAHDGDAIIAFLCNHEWPFHGSAQLSAADAAAIPLVGDGVESFWILDGDEMLGLIRLFGLEDIPDGSPLFDLRIAPEYRGRGVGTGATSWLTSHLFTAMSDLHRVEATTRSDNLAMQTVLERCGYRREGIFREAWRSADGTRTDAYSYGILRSEWASPDEGEAGSVTARL